MLLLMLACNWELPVKTAQTGRWGSGLPSLRECLQRVDSSRWYLYHLTGGLALGWFDPGLMDRLKLVLVTLLKNRRTYITKITMSAFAIIKTFNVIEHVGFRFVSSQVTCTINSLALH